MHKKNEKIGKLVHLDKHMEHLIREKQNAEQQKKEQSMTMDKLHKEKKSEVSLDYSKAALTQAIQNLESANYAQSTKKQEECR